MHIDMATSPGPDGGQPKNFVRPCVLLLLTETRAHGYELLERLREFGFERDAGGLYRALRAMEHQGLVHSFWEPSGSGPDRRTYEPTARGRRWLDAWVANLAETRQTLDRFDQRYQAALGEPA